MRIHAPSGTHQVHGGVDSASVPDRLPTGPGGQAEAIRHLQRTMGNRALQKVLGKRRRHDHAGADGFRGILQTKLQVTTPGDAFEREADRVADQVTASPETADAPVALRAVTPAPDDQTAATDAAGGAAARSLEASDRAFFEPRLGHDFGGVRIHTDAQASQMARHLGARAFTHGRDVYFADGQYDPQSREGRQLLAHELTHVAQQGGQPGVIQRAPPTPASQTGAGNQTQAAALAKLKSALIATYGLAGVVDGSATWTPDELQQVTDAFKMLPKRDRASLKGVTLTRVTSLGGTTAGEFETNQSVSGTTVVNEATLKLADLAFKGGAPASYGVIVHEVGHAVANLTERTATHAEHVATAEHNRLLDISNPAVKAFNDAVDERNNAVDPLNTAADDLNSALGSGDKARIAAARATYKTRKADYEAKLAEENRLKAIWKKADAASKKAEKTAGEKEKAAARTRISAKDLEKIKKGAETALTKHTKSDAGVDKTANALNPADKAQSTAYVAALKAAGTAIKTFADDTKDQDKSDAEVDKMVATVQKEIDARDKAREALATLNKGHPALAGMAAVERNQDALFEAAKAHSLAHRRTARVQKFVKFVVDKGIAPITPYAARNWPHDPEEFYAEAYSMFLTDPSGLKKASKALFDWFNAKKY